MVLCRREIREVWMAQHKREGSHMHYLTPSSARSSIYTRLSIVNYIYIMANSQYSYIQPYYTSKCRENNALKLYKVGYEAESKILNSFDFQLPV